jgi:hypothetical protein
MSQVVGMQRFRLERCTPQQQRPATTLRSPRLPVQAAVIIPYQIVQNNPQYSLRLYSPYTVAEVVYQRRDEGFEVLGSYMAGNNAASQRMKESQPVLMCYGKVRDLTVRVKGRWWGATTRARTTGIRHRSTPHKRMHALSPLPS